MLLNPILGGLAALSLGLTLWQWLVGRRFPLHARIPAAAFAPPVTLLKPLKGCDSFTESCLRSWLAQEYPAPVQLLFGVAAAEDPVCALVRKLLQEFPERDAQLVICGPLAGANLKVAKLAQLARLGRHEVFVISDADVRVPADFLTNAVAPLQPAEVGLVNCFYRLANPVTLVMRWEAVAVNADFWSQVLQSQSLKPLDFALGAVMVTRRELLEKVGGFEALADCLADDYQLGNRLARAGHAIRLSPVVVECWSEPLGWAEVWKHQLRWARTVRVCQPLPYFFSILSNGTLWPLVWLAIFPAGPALPAALVCWAARITAAWDLQVRLAGRGGRAETWWACLGLVPLKDLLQTAIWVLAFLGNRVEWRGERLRLRRDGTLVSAG